MSGNCARGIAAIEIAPASVITIETTRASLGRLMKTSEIIVRCSGSGLRLAGGRRWGRCHLLARLGLLHAIHDHPVALGEAAGDRDGGTGSRPQLHAADLHGVVLLQ